MKAAYSPWNIASVCAIVTLAVLFFLFSGTARSIVEIWNSSGTFTHGYIIVPISAWLIWQSRAVLVQLEPRPEWKGLFAIACAAFVWLMGDLASAQVVRQYAFVSLIPIGAVTLLGWRTVKPILFPLLFVLLAVPFGDMFIDPLINWTADFTVTALQITGIPVFRQGNSFSLPTGNWSVVTACSGVRYLIASLTLGCIYAYLTYRSIWRRAIFLLAALIVPVIANGIRAYLIVMIGHLSDMTLAVGVDHLIYGWVFFGVVMLLLFWVGSFWREDNQPESTITLISDPANKIDPVKWYVHFAAAFAITAIAALGPVYSNSVARAMAQQPPAALGVLPIAGWQESADRFTDWHPIFNNPAIEQFRFFDRQGHKAGFYVGYYRNQRDGSELINYLNVLATPGGDNWHRLDESDYRLQSVNSDGLVRESRLHSGHQQLLTWHTYWTGSSYTSSSYVAKFDLALNRLLMRKDDGAVVILITPEKENLEQTREILQEFSQSALPAIDQLLKQSHAN